MKSKATAKLNSKAAERWALEYKRDRESAKHLNADQLFRLGIIAATNEYREHSIPATLRKREWMLLLAMQDIASGDIRLRDVRTEARVALRSWLQMMGEQT